MCRLPSDLFRTHTHTHTFCDTLIFMEHDMQFCLLSLFLFHVYRTELEPVLLDTITRCILSEIPGCVIYLLLSVCYCCCCCRHHCSRYNQRRGQSCCSDRLGRRKRKPSPLVARPRKPRTKFSECVLWPLK